MPQIAGILGAAGGTALGSAAGGSAAGAMGLGTAGTAAMTTGGAMAGGMLGSQLLGPKPSPQMAPMSMPTPVTQALPPNRMPVQISPNYGLTSSKPDSALEEAIRQLLMRGYR